MIEGFLRQPILIGVAVVAAILLVVAIVKILNELRMMGTLVFMSKAWFVIGGVSLIGVGGCLVAAAQPYTPPAADSIAIVVGNTQNTPQAKLNDQIEDLIRQTLMRHQGEEAEELADAISIIEADGRPYVVDLDYHKLRSISQNSAQATTDVDYNLKQINQQLSTVVPRASGANYLEAILLARDEVDDDANIVVIGSGLSDTGDLNFVGSNILTDSKAEADVVGQVIDEHQDALRGSDITLMGLGDTVAPQSSLSSTQREVVRNIYKEVIRGLGGHAIAAGRCG